MTLANHYDLTSMHFVKMAVFRLVNDAIDYSSESFLTLLSCCAAVSKANFVYHFCIGKGGFGKVWRVERKKAKQYYAMKEMSKARIITKRSVKSVINER